MALSLVKTNRLGFFALEGSGLQKLMIVNFVKNYYIGTFKILGLPSLSPNTQGNCMFKNVHKTFY